MTIKQFSKMTGIDYQEVVTAVARSGIRVRGRLVEYNSENLKQAVIDYLKQKERKKEHELAEVRRSICSAHQLDETWV